MQPIDHAQALPISEDFHSLQGEGAWVGTPMHFIRLAGCSVGESQIGRLSEQDVKLPILKTGELAWLCHTYDGRPFWCDTDFKFRHWSTFHALLDDTWEKHICLTGGEPLMHAEKLEEFIDLAEDRGIKIHIETSGTIDFQQHGPWISVAPKLGVLPAMIDFADEIKLLVDENFDLTKVPTNVLAHYRVYVQPVNDELQVSRANFERCMEILRVKPEWSLSVQQHKLLGLR